MALHTLPIAHKAIDVEFSESSSRLAVLSDTDLAVYALDMHKRPISKPTLVWKSDAFKNCCPRHVAFVGDENICVLTDSWDDDESSLWMTAGETLELRGPVLEPHSVSSLIPSQDFRKLFLQFQDGTLHELDEIVSQNGSPPTSSLVHKFPSLAPEVTIVTAEGQVSNTAATAIRSSANKCSR